MKDEILFLKLETDGDALISSDREFQALMLLTLKNFERGEEILVGL